MNEAAADQALPRAYRLAGFWSCALLVLAAAATGVGGLGIWRTWIGHEAPGAPLAFLAAFGLCCLAFASYLIALVARATLVLTGDEIRVTGVFATRMMSREEILGYRTIRPRNTPPVLVLVPREDGRPNVRVSGMFRKNAVIQDWLGGLPDLDARDVESAKKELERNSALGATPEERANSIRRAQRIRGWLGAAAAVGMLGWFCPSSFRVIDVLLLAIPWAVVYVTARSKGVIGINERKHAPGLGLAVPFMFPQFVLLMRATGDTEMSLLGWREPLILATLLGAILTFAAWRAEGASRGQARLWVFLLLLSLAYGYATVRTADALLDRAQPAVFKTVLVGKYVGHGKVTSYWLRLSPWGPRQSVNRVEVSRGFHDSKQIGDTVCVDLHPGALEIPWYSVRSCS